MKNKKFYVYKWYNLDTNEVFYIGKGCRNRKNNINDRNKIFQEYYINHNCTNEIVKYFDDEQEALVYEKELITYYRSIGQAQANIDEGGHGGLSFSWTQEMRDYKSKYNPMKEEKQKQRMSEQNPMKNPEIAKKVGLKHRRPIVIDGIKYDSAAKASEALHVSEVIIREWCQRGYNSNGTICRFEDELNKNFPPFEIINSHNHKIVQIDNKYFTTAKEAAEAFNFSYSSFVRKLKNYHGNMIYKGHVCSYANQQPSQENNQ